MLAIITTLRKQLSCTHSLNFGDRKNIVDNSGN